MRIQQLDPIPDGAISPDQELALDDPSQTFKITLGQLKDFMEAYFVAGSAYKPRSDSLNNTERSVPVFEGDCSTLVAGSFVVTDLRDATNIPPSNAIYLYMETKSTFSETALLQTAWPYAAALADYEGEIWFRVKPYSGDWSEWRRVYDSGNPPTADDVGAVSKADPRSGAAQVDAADALTRKDYVDGLTVSRGVGADILPSLPSFLTPQKGGLYKAVGAGNATPTPGAPPGSGNNTLSVVCLPIASGINHYVAVENSGATPSKLWHGTNQSGVTYWTQVHTDAAPSAATLELKSEVDQLREELGELRAMLLV